jgi:hypothetical protein
MFQTSLELGNNPHHFSQMGWSQGVLLQRANMPLLLRTGPEGESQITRGEVLGNSSEVFGLSSFLLKNRLFGLEPGTDVRAYVDTDGRATLLTSDLEFMMDITDPVAKYRRQQEHLRMVQNFPDDSDFWLRSEDPVLLMSTVPAKTDHKPPTTKALIFRGGGDNKELTWTLPMRVAGTVQNPDFFRRVRHDRTTPAIGISGQRTMNYFQLVATPAAQVIDTQAMYSPLLRDGSLVLYDQTSESPIVTDAKVIGMIGSHSGAA